MRVVLVMSEASLWKPAFVRNLVELLPERYKAAAVFLTSFQPSRVTFFQHLTRYLTMLGIWGFIRMAVREVCAGILDRIDRVIPLSRDFSIRGICRKKGIPCFYVEDVNDPDVICRIRTFEPDFLVSSGNRIFGKDLLSSAKVACLNRHSSLLPAYQGIYPVFWCLLNDEQEAGVSVHVMTEKVDEGPILAQVTVPIGPDETFFSLFERCFRTSAPVVIEALEKAGRGDFSPVVNGREKSVYSYPGREDVRRFREKGKRMM